MANAEHLEILKSGVEKWNKWRERNPFIRPDLSQIDLPNVDLWRANLSNANLFLTNLAKSNLNGAQLNGANLSNVCLIGASLSGSNLSDGILSFADFTKAKLQKANLSSSEIKNTILASSDLYQANMSNANLIGVDLSNANLNCANLINANLIGAKLVGSSMLQSNLSYSIFQDTDLSRATLMGADLSHAMFRSVNLFNADFEKCKISRTIFSLTNLGTVKGLHTVKVGYPCTIDFQTLRTSKNLPKSFLLKIGLPELFIDYLPDFYSDTLNFYPVFLSHSWKNKDFARKLYEALIAKGVNVFFDEKKMKPGDDIYESISKGINLYDKMILVCSKESLSESWWVDRELDRILKKERDLFKERGQRINLLIPITLDDFIFSWDGAKAEEVRRYVIGDFRDWQDEAKFEKALSDLIHALNADRSDVKPRSLL